MDWPSSISLHRSALDGEIEDLSAALDRQPPTTARRLQQYGKRLDRRNLLLVDADDDVAAAQAQPSGVRAALHLDHDDARLGIVPDPKFLAHRRRKIGNRAAGKRLPAPRHARSAGPAPAFRPPGCPSF